MHSPSNIRPVPLAWNKERTNPQTPFQTYNIRHTYLLVHWFTSTYVIRHFNLLSYCNYRINARRGQGDKNPRLGLGNLWKRKKRIAFAIRVANHKNLWNFIYKYICIWSLHMHTFSLKLGFAVRRWRPRQDLKKPHRSRSALLVIFILFLLNKIKLKWRNKNVFRILILLFYFLWLFRLPSNYRN